MSTQHTDSEPKSSATENKTVRPGRAELLDALAKLSNEVLGSLPLMEELCRREFGNTNYALLIQRAEEARAILARAGTPVMTEIEFTQYMRPNGRPETVRIDRPKDVAAKAEQIIAAGFRFECESLMSGHISLTIADDSDDYAIEVCDNGKAVPAAVDKLITEFSIARAKRERKLRAGDST